MKKAFVKKEETENYKQTENTLYHIWQGKNIIENDQIQEQKSKISRFIKEQLGSKNLSIFIGSGCSTPGVPLMSKIIKELTDKCPNINAVVNRYKKRFNISKNRTGSQKSVDIESLLSWMTSGLAYNPKNQRLKKDLDSIKSEFLKYIPRCSSEKYGGETFDRYVTFYESIFKERKPNQPKLSIFTTNYDLFNEYALDANNIVYTTGFDTSLKRYFNISRFNYRIVDDTDKYKDRWQPTIKEANLYKLHGSINWKTTESGTLYQDDSTNYENSKIVDDNNVVIYPTILKHKETAQAPYSELFRSFANSLQRQNSTLIIIGYGFGDEHINTIIRQNLKNQDFNLIVFGDKLEERVKEFTNKCTSTNFHLIGGLNEGKYAHYFDYIVKEFFSKEVGDEEE
ncbi:hypothetical protein HHJ76_11470 [Mobiluncus mulieris]|uniref:SIR2 family protein n=1 Tax=Mobiluncus mulieris TaxID=2052 RepID=UPI0014706219|nr:SIR2 family protein [Mobiluncus mulieris]NMW63905.1 hypothetical protein [Mobiluncus mulieris]